MEDALKGIFELGEDGHCGEDDADDAHRPAERGVRLDRSQEVGHLVGHAGVRLLGDQRQQLPWKFWPQPVERSNSPPTASVMSINGKNDSAM